MLGPIATLNQSRRMGDKWRKWRIDGDQERTATPTTSDETRQILPTSTFEEGGDQQKKKRKPAVEPEQPRERETRVSRAGELQLKWTELRAETGTNILEAREVRDEVVGGAVVGSRRRQTKGGK